MASVNFLYRSTKDVAPLNIRLLYTYEGNDYVIGGKTQYVIAKSLWDIYKKGKGENLTKIEVLQEQTRINNDLTPLNTAIVEAFNKSHNPSLLNKKWLQSIIDNYYKKPDNENRVPSDLVSFIDYYIDKRQKEVKPASITKYNVIKHKLERIQKEVGKIFYIEELDIDFIEDFGDYYIENNYSLNTRSKEFNIIKTFLKYARKKKKNVNDIVLTHSFKKGEAKNIYLNFDEIDKIYNTEIKEDYLDNARDWLIISCYVGQRISDFMRFKKDMIKVVEEEKFIQFTQKKTNKELEVPLHHRVIEILDKRKGEFPRQISDQRYNDYIKEVCRLSGITELTEGKKQINIAEDDNASIIRNVLGKYPKNELVTSHIGRRSFASNYYGKIPTPYLINVTGHSTEEIFLNYVIIEAKDLSKQLSKNKFFLK